MGHHRLHLSGHGGERRQGLVVSGQDIVLGTAPGLSGVLSGLKAGLNLVHAVPHGLHGLRHLLQAVVEFIPGVLPGVLGFLQIFDVLQILHRARRHGHDHADGFKAVRADAHRVVPFLPGKSREHHRRGLSQILGLSALSVHAVAFAHIYGHRHHQQHVVAVILPCAVVGRGLHIDLDQPRSPGQLVRVNRHAVELVGHVEIPGQRHLVVAHGALVVKTPRLVRRHGPGHGSVPDPGSLAV